MRTYKRVTKFLSWLLPISVFKNGKEMSSKTWSTNNAQLRITEIEDSFVQIYSTACLSCYCNLVQTTGFH